MLALCLLLFAGRFEFVEPVMGTLARIVLYAPDETAARAAAQAAFLRLRELDARLSDYRDDSEIAQLSTTPKKVSGDLWRVLSHAQKLAAESDGAFDVTVGPLTRAWRERRWPYPEERMAVDWKKLLLDPAQQTVAFAEAGMRLDLGGIAKGYAADEALKVLAARGLLRAMVALSGDIAVAEAPPGRAGWRIALAQPDMVLIVKRAGVSTSGDSEQFWERDLMSYSHIVNTQSGVGFTEPRTVTVRAASGMEADACATALRALGRALPSCPQARFTSGAGKVEIAGGFGMPQTPAVEKRAAKKVRAGRAPKPAPRQASIENGTVSLSSDGGKTWSEAQELPPSLAGNSHHCAALEKDAWACAFQRDGEVFVWLGSTAELSESEPGRRLFATGLRFAPTGLAPDGRAAVRIRGPGAAYRVTVR